MKKLIIILCFVGVFIAVNPTLSAFASESGSEPSNVTITVVMPDNTATTAPIQESTPDVPAIAKVYPSDVRSWFRRCSPR
jgi:hypothetical protein